LVIRMISKLLENLYRLFRSGDSEYNTAVLRKRGAKIGLDVNYFSEHMADKGEAERLSIGDYTTISTRVSFIFHDGAEGPLINRNPRFMTKNIHVRKCGKISIGNHVFIGAGSIILPSVTIGDFSIIAAGSVVTKDVPGWEVWGGVPARFIKSSVDWVEKVLRSNQISMNRSEIEECLTVSPSHTL
jgi:acetyltransferase-like isoleucine patch superfamily enzyme